MTDVPSRVPKHLKTMQWMARMKEKADAQGFEIIFGFVDSNDKKHVVTNMNPEDFDKLCPKSLKD